MFNLWFWTAPEPFPENNSYSEIGLKEYKKAITRSVDSINIGKTFCDGLVYVIERVKYYLTDHAENRFSFL